MASIPTQSISQNPFDKLHDLVPHSFSDLSLFYSLPFSVSLFPSLGIADTLPPQGFCICSVVCVESSQLAALLAFLPHLLKSLLKRHAIMKPSFHLIPQHYLAPLSTFLFSPFHSVCVLYVFL